MFDVLRSPYIVSSQTQGHKPPKRLERLSDYAVKTDEWLSWARRSQLPAFIHLAKKISRHRHAIDANLEHDLSQGLIESTNTKIRLLPRIAYGFHGPQPLIALALLALGAHPPRLPG